MCILDHESLLTVNQGTLYTRQPEKKVRITFLEFNRVLCYLTYTVSMMTWNMSYERDCTATQSLGARDRGTLR